MEVCPPWAYIGDPSPGPNPNTAVIRYIPFLLLAGFLAEIASIIVVGRWVGVVPTLGLIVLAAFLGMRVIKNAGMSLAEAIRHNALTGRPADAIGRILVVSAGLLLIVPGFLSDLAALILLFPPAAQWLARKLAGMASRPAPRQGPVIEGQAVEIDIQSPRFPSPMNPLEKD